jgi:C1A family cysteine protease
VGALALFGVPPEDYWPYKIVDFDKEPPAFAYSFAQSYQALKYYRLDPPNVSRVTLLDQIKANIHGGIPPIFRFTVYSSIDQAGHDGAIPFPSEGEKIEGGHAVVAVGYDDSIKITNDNDPGPETTGALKIRNSWGAGWLAAVRVRSSRSRRRLVGARERRVGRHGAIPREPASRRGGARRLAGKRCRAMTPSADR